MTDSPTRRELEKAVRALIPGHLLSTKALTSEGSRKALSGAGGLLTAYARGFLRGRKRRRAREKRDHHERA